MVIKNSERCNRLVVYMDRYISGKPQLSMRQNAQVNGRKWAQKAAKSDGLSRNEVGPKRSKWIVRKKWQRT